MADQLRDKKGKLISDKVLDKMTDKELKSIVQYNIEKYNWTPPEEEETDNKENSEDSTAEESNPDKNNETSIESSNSVVKDIQTPKRISKAVFGSKPSGLRINENGFDIRFSEGKYETSNKAEIEFLKVKAKNPIPFSKVELVDEITE